MESDLGVIGAGCDDISISIERHSLDGLYFFGFWVLAKETDDFVWIDANCSNKAVFTTCKHSIFVQFDLEAKS